MEKRRRHGDGFVSVSGAAACLLLLCALALLLPHSSGAKDQEWRASSNPGRPQVWQWHHHADGLPPLSAPPPTAGGDLPPPPSLPPSTSRTTPHFGFPLQPTVGSASAAPPRPSGEGEGEGYPFIGSNPTVPLPTGMTDTATVLPLPDTATGDAAKAVGFAAAPVGVHISTIGLVLLFAIVFLSTTF